MEFRFRFAFRFHRNVAHGELSDYSTLINLNTGAVTCVINWEIRQSFVQDFVQCGSLQSAEGVLSATSL